MILPVVAPEFFPTSSFLFLHVIYVTLLGQLSVVVGTDSSDLQSPADSWITVQAEKKNTFTCLTIKVWDMLQKYRIQF